MRALTVKQPWVSLIDERHNENIRVIQQTLELAGWDILALDVGPGTLRIELQRQGRLVTLDARNGTASVTREHVETLVQKRGRRGDVYRPETLSVTFLGRQRYEGVRSAMRGLANYVVDNSPLPLIGERRVFRALIQELNKEEIL